MGGEIKLSGAYINTDPNVGGGGAYEGAQTLFTAHFRVKSGAPLGPFTLELQQTMLCNGPAGWGVDHNHKGVKSPISSSFLKQCCSERR